MDVARGSLIRIRGSLPKGYVKVLDDYFAGSGSAISSCAFGEPVSQKRE